MNSQANTLNSTSIASSEQLKQEIAQYVEQLPDSKQALHTWMKRLEAAGVGIIVGVFITALYISVEWKSFNPVMIPTAWFAFVISFAPAIILVGIHAILLSVYPPVVLPGKIQQLVIGRRAIWTGVGYILLGLAVASFWGIFAYATWTLNWALLKPLISILGVVMGIVMVVSMLVKMVSTTGQKISKIR